MTRDARIVALHASAFTIPTDAPEADGTFAWDKTTLVVVEIAAGGETGLGYTYSDACLVGLIKTCLASHVMGADALDIPACHASLERAVRNLGRSGLCACALSAIDAALWDLKAKLLDLPLARLLGMQRCAVEVYGSGGFTSYSDEKLAEQLVGWVSRDGCCAAKMKIGSHPDRDPQRVAVARKAIGTADLFVDANGAFTCEQALGIAEILLSYEVTWFEEPVSSDDPAGLQRVRAGAPPQMSIVAGEYSFTPDDAHRLLCAQAVDVLQADVTRCGGITGFLAIGTLCAVFHLDLSGHCAPALHRHVACAVPRLRHLEWFHDHVRIESMLFEGAPCIKEGMIDPDLREPGHGLILRRADAAPFRVAEA